jgi:hypothetical protein
MNGEALEHMPTMKDLDNYLKDFVRRHYVALIVVLLLVLNYALFNTIYVNFFLHVGKATKVGEIQAQELTGKYAIDKHGEARFDGQETYQMIGWAFPEIMAVPLADYRKQIVLINDQSVGYYFDPLDMTRIDVTRAFVKLGVNVDQSGWLVNISKYVLPKGRYNLAFLFLPPDSSGPLLFRTSVYLTRTANTLQFSQ